MRTARLVSGLVMMAFVTMHLVNLSLSLISIETAEAARWWFMFIWRTPVGTLALYGSAVVHVALVLRTLYLKRTLVMPLKEAAQIALGLLIPLVIAEHVIGTTVFSDLSGIDASYQFVVRALWIDTPIVGFKQVLALLIVWAHACLGLHFWLRFRPWYPRAAPFLLIAAVLVPVLALLGFSDAGREVETMGRPPLPPDVDAARLTYALAQKDFLLRSIYIGFVASLAAVFILRALRDRTARRNRIEVRYGSGQTVDIPRGSSVLEASRIGGIPHYSVCGGKGRCSTCRVKVIDGLDKLLPAGPVERMTLARIGAEPDVRLACQLRPTHNLTVVPLLAAQNDPGSPTGARVATPGREQDITVLFCDIRSFTELSDTRLPYDVVFLLNRYFAVVGKAVEQSGGVLDKFIGDGAMALFGLRVSKEEACRQALAAAVMILRDLDRLSEDLAKELPKPLRVAIGIHAGPAIVGAMGYGGVMNVTAIGDTVNVASRLESAAKEFNAAIVISDAAAQLSGVDVSAFELREIEVRGTKQPVGVRVIPQGERFEVLPGKVDAIGTAA